MTGDPFDALRLPEAAVPPDTAFVARLRRQVVDALTTALPAVDLPVPHATPRSAPMTDTTTATAATPVAVIPYLCVAGAATAIEWYRDVLGAAMIVRYDGDDGRVGHAELAIAGAPLYLADEHPEVDVISPTSLGGTAVSLQIRVTDVDRTFATAVAAGARGEREPADQPYGLRAATFRDPFGHRWFVESPLAELTLEEIDAAMPGYTVTAGPSDAELSPPRGAADDDAAARPVELGYFTMAFPDTAVASRFYGALFGWITEGGSMGEGYAHVANTALPSGLTPGDVDDGAVLYFRVPELGPFVTRVTELGGRVLSEATYDSGAGAECRDDQGRVFHLWEPASGY